MDKTDPTVINYYYFSTERRKKQKLYSTENYFKLISSKFSEDYNKKD